MILFLDFDGVLHPSPSGELGIFCHLERFEAILRAHPTVEFVISSSWRLTYPEDVIVGIFADDIQSRIIGMTPEIKDNFQYPRHAEILAWLDGAAYHGPWIALDDAADEFPESCENLLLCEVEIGFDEMLAQRLRRILENNDPVS